MRRSWLQIDTPWRARICFVLAGAIFVLSQFIAAMPPPGQDDDAGRSTGSILAETDSDEAGAALD
jgi:hypothetical protein